MRIKTRFTRFGLPPILLVALVLTLVCGTTAYAYVDETEATEDTVAEDTGLEGLDALPDDDYSDLLALIEAEAESAVEETEPNPLTPEGTGTVMDNATSDEGKEFFTITTEAGNIFYLIIDRDRETDNVYFLNAVTEADLMALAEASDTTTESESAIPDTGSTVAPLVTEDEEDDEPEDGEPEPSGTSGISYGLILLLVAAAAGAGYYIKIVLPKRQPTDLDDDYDEDDEDDDYDYEEDYGEEPEDEMDPAMYLDAPEFVDEGVDGEAPDYERDDE